MDKNSNYKWIILVSSFLIMAVPFSINSAISPLFIAPVTQNFGFSIGEFSFLFTLSSITMALFSPIIGNLVNKHDIRIIMSVGSVVTGVGFLGYSYANNLYMFYAISIIVALGISCIGIVPISTMISNWFEPSKRGSMMGIAFAGIGCGTFLWMQVATRLIQSNGFKYSYGLLGFIMLIVTLPICIFLVRKSPKEATTNENKDSTVTKAPPLDFKSISSAPNFWIFSIGLLLMGISVSGVQLHVQSYLVALGHPLTFNANVGSTLAIFALCGNILGGIIFDKFNIKAVLILFASLTLIALASLILASNTIFCYIFAATFGICLGMPALWPSYGVNRLFGGKNYAVILGIVNMFFAIGGAIGPSISGALADTRFGYKSAWLIYSCLVIVYYLLFIRAVSKTTKEA